MPRDLLATVIGVVEPFVPKGTDLSPDTPLLGSGLLDSLNMVQIVMVLEQRLGLKITADLLAFEDFETCRRLATTLTSKVAA